MARPGQRQAGARRNAPRKQRRVRHSGDVISELARIAREVEAAVRSGRVTPAVRAKFQAVTLLLRDERARVRAADGTDSHRAEQLKRLDGIAAILATTAVGDAGLLALLAEDSGVSDAARSLKREMARDLGIEPAPEQIAPAETVTAPAGPVSADTGRRVVPQSVISRQLANPFLAPDFSAVPQRTSGPRRLADWELLGPLLSSFERAGRGAPACMALPAPTARFTPEGLELMRHQGQVVAAAAAGHRAFLLADEPGLGKTAQALLAAEAANAYPLLVVVPNVVKTNWAREAARWTPRRRATVVQGDGEAVDGFADIVVVNYEVLDRHMGWLGDFGFRGMVVDEAHFIKNKTSQRSQHVLALSARIRSRTDRPLLMALTGTPLINDIEDFRAIWQFLGWIDDSKPLDELMDALEDTGLTPADRGFSAAARQCVIDLGIVRHRKVDVAADIPARRIADLPVELDGRAGRSIRAAERDLADRMVARYQTALANRSSDAGAEGIDHDLVRQVARWELKDAMTAQSGDNVFTMMRRIGRAKAELAADYAAQLARSAGKVVFFAKHVDVMDAAEEVFARQGVRFSSIRGGQTPTARQAHVDAFVNDPDVAVAVCSLTAAGVGLNLQVASNIVLAELSWTDAEQTQAIDRSHRIGQAEPVTAWRIIAAQTIDARIAGLIDSKAGLAARALDGSGQEASSPADVQLEALVAVLTDALRASSGRGDAQGPVTAGVVSVPAHLPGRSDSRNRTQAARIRAANSRAVPRAPASRRRREPLTPMGGSSYADLRSATDDQWSILPGGDRVYAWLVERLIRRAFDRLSRGDPSAVLAIFGANTRWCFPGSSSWGIDTTDRAAIEAWFRRFASLGVEFTIHDVVVKGPPWNTKVRTQGSDRIATTSGAEYINHWVQCAHLAWGKLTEDVVYLDTERLAAFDSVLTAANG